jgi:hypothetical protein
MFLITARLQVPEIGLDAHVNWQPNYFQYLFRHVHMTMAFDIVVFTQFPLIHITPNFAYAGN